MRKFNLIQRGNVWHYQRRVPLGLVQSLGRSVIKYSLKTTELAVACQLRDIAEVKWSEEFRRLSANHTLAATPELRNSGSDETKRIVRDFVKGEISEFASLLTNHPPENAQQVRQIAEDQDFQRYHLQAGTQHADEWLSAAWDKIKRKADAKLVSIRSNNENIDFLLRGLIEIVAMKQLRIDRDYSKTHIDLGFAPQAVEIHSFGQLTLEYLQKYKDTAKTNERTQKAVDKVVQNVALICDLVGKETDVATIDYDTSEKIRFKLAKVPTNYKKIFKGKSLDEAISLAGESKAKLLSVKSQRQYLGAFQQLLNLAKSKKWLAELPQAELKPVREEKVKDKDKRDAFSIAQLVKFFGGPFYATAVKSAVAQERPDFVWRFWLPIIALFTGMRANEICQLLTTDISETESGTYFIAVSAAHVEVNGPDVQLSKSLKNASSSRKIPIHQTLVELGFLDFCERRLMESGQARLLIGLKADKYGNLFSYPGKRFNEVFLPREMGVGPKQSFHSFRHTFRDALRKIDASPDTLQALGGWNQGGLTSSKYGDLSQPDQQLKFINVVKFGNLDLCHLKAIDWKL